MQRLLATYLIPLLKHLQQAFKRELGSVEMLRGLKIFTQNTLYLVKPLSQTVLDQDRGTQRRRRHRRNHPLEGRPGEALMVIGDATDWDDLFPYDLLPRIFDLVIESWEMFEKPAKDDQEVPITRASDQH